MCVRVRARLRVRCLCDVCVMFAYGREWGSAQHRLVIASRCCVALHRSRMAYGVLCCIASSMAYGVLCCIALQYGIRRAVLHCTLVWPGVLWFAVVVVCASVADTVVMYVCLCTGYRLLAADE